MLNNINLKKITARTLIGVLITGGFVAQSGITKALASNGVQGIELRYLDSAIQCGDDPTQARVEVEVYDQINDTKIATLSKGEKFITTEVDSIDDLFIKYKIFNLSCLTEGGYRATQDRKILASDSEVPTVQGFNGQASITQMLQGLDSYEELFLVELGNRSPSSAGYDLQDVVLVVDHNPDSLITARNYAD
ncbi:MAG: hypothetical protein AAFY63_12585 [Cyanobacteria bacterium J06643_13]